MKGLFAAVRARARVVQGQAAAGTPIGVVSYGVQNIVAAVGAESISRTGGATQGAGAGQDKLQAAGQLLGMAA
ncbi:hypothetical protein GCM10011450_12120 [Advenella faeciporci]|uniref:Uncharacterized protein n=1 Tax=Advenella faeciporci TaxID=797535 RepID=A0A918JJS8_9BURK|nr:hypothetical protein [Advenella faeciporci]GGW83615.1 hypothetical protein GCM10011450_12120 [Advenella faeciporci]